MIPHEITKTREELIAELERVKAQRDELVDVLKGAGTAIFMHRHITARDRDSALTGIADVIAKVEGLYGAD